MKPWCTRVLVACLSALFAAPTLCHADPVGLSVGGHLLGEYSLGANQTVQDTFSLSQATQLTSLSVGIQPDYGSMYYTYEVTLTGPGGTYNVLDASSFDTTAPDQSSTPLPSILAAGDYTLNFIGGPCTGFCTPGFSMYVAGIDFYAPGTYTQTGGSITTGSFGFTLTGTTVPPAATSTFGAAVPLAAAPEPGTWALLATGLAGIPARRYLRGLRRGTRAIPL